MDYEQHLRGSLDAVSESLEGAAAAVERAAAAYWEAFGTLATGDEAKALDEAAALIRGVIGDD